jgi:hypothetical protein
MVIYFLYFLLILLKYLLDSTVTNVATAAVVV